MVSIFLTMTAHREDTGRRGGRTKKAELESPAFLSTK